MLYLGASTKMLSYTTTINYSLLRNIFRVDYTSLANLPNDSNNFWIIGLIFGTVNLLWLISLTIYICVNEKRKQILPERRDEIYSTRGKELNKQNPWFPRGISFEINFDVIIFTVNMKLKPIVLESKRCSDILPPSIDDK